MPAFSSGDKHSIYESKKRRIRVHVVGFHAVGRLGRENVVSWNLGRVTTFCGFEKTVSETFNSSQGGFHG